MPPKKKKPSQFRDAITRINSALEAWNQVSEEKTATVNGPFRSPMTTRNGPLEDLDFDHSALFSKLAEQMRELSGEQDG